MIVGYKGLSTMCDTNAVMLDSTDLYPDGTVVLAGMGKPRGKNGFDQALLYGAALTCRYRRHAALCVRERHPEPSVGCCPA